MEPPGPPVTATLPTNSGLKSTRARLVPLPRPKVDAVRPKPEPGYGGMSPASAGSPMTMPAKSPKIKAEDAKPDSDVKNFRLRSGFAVGVPGALPALNVMRFTGAPAGRSTDMATWKQPIKMYRIEPAGTGEEEEGEDGGPPRWQLQRRRDEHDDPEAAPPPSGPREQMDLTKVDERTAKRRARASKKKLRPWRGGRSALDDETLTNTAALNAEIERRAQQRKDAAIAQLPFVLKDASGEADNEYEGELEEGLDGDQYVLLRFSKDGFVVHPVKNFYDFAPKSAAEFMTVEEAEARMKARRRAEAARDAAFMKRTVKEEGESYNAIQEVLSRAGVAIKSEEQLEMELKRLVKPAGLVARRNVGRDDDDVEDWDFERDASDDEGSDNGGAAWDDDGVKHEAKERRLEEQRRYRATKVKAETEGKDVEEVLFEEFGDGDTAPKPKKKLRMTKGQKRMKSVLQGKRSRKREGKDESDDEEGDDERDPYIGSSDESSSSSDESSDGAVILSKEEEAKLRRRELEKNKKSAEEGATSALSAPSILVPKKPETPEIREKVKLRIPVRKALMGAGSDSELSDASHGSGMKRKRETSPVAQATASPLKATVSPQKAVALPPAPAIAPAASQPTTAAAAPSEPAVSIPTAPADVVARTGTPGGASTPAISGLKIKFKTAAPPGGPSTGPPATTAPISQKTNDRQMSDGDMSDGGVPARKKMKREADSQDLLTEQDVINALLPHSQAGKRVPMKELVSLLKDKIRRNMEANTNRIKHILSKVADTKQGEGVMLKPQFMGKA